MPIFISFEGGEGTGKTTQAEMLAERLLEAGYQVVPLHEPGTTRLGIYLRDWLKREASNKDAVSPLAELFVFAAARAELVTKVVRPALARRARVAVVVDRYADSTTAYQGYGRGLPLADVEKVNAMATLGIKPDITFLLDAPPEAGLSRVSARRMLPLDVESSQQSPLLEVPADPQHGRLDPEGTQRFEDESLGFHRRVREGYLSLVEREPERIRVIDATRPADEIGETVWSEVQKKIAEDRSESDAPSSTTPPLFDLREEQA